MILKLNNKVQLNQSLLVFLSRDLNLFWSSNTFNSWIFCIISISAIIIFLQQVSFDIQYTLILIILFFTVILNSSNIIKQDYERGIFEHFLLSGTKMEIVVFSKFLAHLIINALIVILIFPWVIFLLQAKPYIFLMLNILIYLSFISIVILFGNALVIGKKKNIHLLIAVYSFSIPSFIFSILAIHKTQYILLMFILFLFFLPILIYFTSMTIKQSLNK